MRHVKYDPTEITYPADWLSRVAAAKATVESASSARRSDEVNRHNRIWADLKHELSKVMYGKCWYTEALQIGTDTDVDHFRPKNAVKGVHKAGTDKDHPGYWWQAFDPANYRYSCIVANRRRQDNETGHVGGKAAAFPLWDESDRAWEPTDDCECEQPLLIDPCDEVQVGCITFAENGEATPRYSEAEKPRFYAMARCSIDLYHLNHSEFKNARIEIRNKIMRHIEDAKRYYKSIDTDGSNTQHAYKRAIQELRKARSEEAPFSSFAISLTDAYRLEDCLFPVFR